MSFNPSPTSFGSSSGSDLEVMYNDLLASLGTAFANDHSSVVSVYMNAIARVFNDVFEQNKRLANQWDPLRMTDFLNRWEAILGIEPLTTDTLFDRRAKVNAKIGMTGKVGTQQVVSDLLRLVLGNDVFVSINNNDSNTANAYVLGGATIPGGATIASGPWYSTVSYLPIKVVQPSYMDDLTFYQTVSQLYSYLESLVPAWVTYDWYRQSKTLGTGFYLDDEFNLDNEAFDV